MYSKPKYLNHIAFVDVETTDLPKRRPEDGSEDYSHIRVLDLCIEIWDRAKDQTVLTYNQRFRLSEAQRAAASPQALEVNGYSDEEWKDEPYADSPEATAIWQEITGILSGTMLCGQNIPFDHGCILAEIARHKTYDFSRGFLPWQRRVIDVQSYGHLIADKLNVVDRKGNYSWGLEFVYNALGGPALQPHRAKPDVERAKYVYKYMERHYRTSLELSNR